MTISNCSRYQRRAAQWLKVCIGTSLLFLLVLLFMAKDSTFLLITGIVGVVFSLTGVLTCWLFEKYYRQYEVALSEFLKMPALASWSVAHAQWGDYRKIEQEIRKREYIKYLLWSPLLIGFIAIMVWSEVDDLPFNANLIWWGAGGYTFLIAVLYLQMRNSATKPTTTEMHQITLKTTGASLDDEITFWGKLTAHQHDTLAQSLNALLFAKTDKERRVNKTYIHQEGGLSYVVINYQLDEQNQRDLFLPLPHNLTDEITRLLSLVGTESAGSATGETKKYATHTYLKWALLAATILSGLFWLVEKGLPIYHESKATQLFNEGVVLFDAGNHGAALSKYQESLQHSTEIPETFHNIGIIYSNDNQPDSAMKYYDLALALKPDFDLSLFQKGSLYYQQNEFIKTIETFKQFEKALPENHDHDLMMGDAYYNLQDADSALLYYSRAYQEGKQSSALSYMLGRVMIDRNELQEAARYLEETVQLDSTFADGFLTLAEIYEQLGNSELSNKNFRKGAQLQRTEMN